MSEVAQTAQGENPAFSCGAAGQPLTGQPRSSSTLPASFVDQQVQFVATATRAGGGSLGLRVERGRQLERYFQSHLSNFDTVCFTVAVILLGERRRRRPRPRWRPARRSRPWPRRTQGGGPQGCAVLADVTARICRRACTSASLPLNTVSDPIDENGNYFLVEVTKRTPTAFSAVKSLANAGAIEQAGATKTQKVVVAATTDTSDVNVNPQYGVWVSVPGTILVPLAPPVSDVPNAKANEPATSSSSASASASPFSG